MSEHNGSQDNGPQEEEGATFDRGSALSLFKSDRLEDSLALLFSLAIALGVYILY